MQPGAPIEPAVDLPVPVDAAALLLAMVRYLSHLDAVVYRQTRPEKYIDEGASTVANALQLQRQSTNPMRVTFILVSCLTKATVLNLDGLQLQLPAGVSALPVSKLLRGQVPVSLATQDGSAAQMTLLLMGEEYPTTTYSSGVSGG